MKIFGSLVKPKTVSIEPNVVKAIERRCIRIETKPKRRLNSSCYTVKAVVQECGYTNGYNSGVSDGYAHLYNLNHERYGSCVENTDFILGYNDGFNKIMEDYIIDDIFDDITKTPRLIIKEIDGEKIEYGVNYDFRTNTYFVTNTSNILFYDYDHIPSRNYQYHLDENANANLTYNYDGTFTWILNEQNDFKDDSTAYVAAIDVGMQKSLNDGTLTVSIMEKTKPCSLFATGGRLQPTKIKIRVEDLTFQKGFKVHADTLYNVEFKDTRPNGIYYDDKLNEFIKVSGTTYYDGSYDVYSEEHGIIGTYPFSIEKGMSYADIEFYTRELSKLKIVFKIKSKNYLKSKSEFSYCELEIDAVADTFENPIIGQLSEPSWFELSSIKLYILNYKVGHKYAVYLKIDDAEGGDLSNYVSPALYLDNVVKDNFYIPFSEYQFKNKVTNQYGYHWVGRVLVFDVTDGFDNVDLYAEGYLPKIDYSPIKKVSHWAGVTNNSTHVGETKVWYKFFTHYPPAYNSITRL